MTDHPRRDFTPLTVRLAVLWLASGSLFKLFAGTPADLPPVLLDALPKDLWGLLLEVAIAVELSITCAALLRPRLLWPLVLAIYAVFEVVLVFGVIAGDASCGCFGAKITIPPAVMMGIDGLFLLLLLLGRPWRSKAEPVGPFWLVPLAAVGCTVLPFWYIGEQELVVDVPGPDGGGPGTTSEPSKVPRWITLDIMKWEGKLVYDTTLASLIPELDALPIDARVEFYRPDCEHCAAHLQELAATDDGSMPIVLIRIEEPNQGDPQVQTLPIGGHVTEVTLPKGPQYLLETPAELRLEGGVVKDPREGIEEDDAGE